MDRRLCRGTRADGRPRWRLRTPNWRGKAARGQQAPLWRHEAGNAVQREEQRGERETLACCTCDDIHAIMPRASLRALSFAIYGSLIVHSMLLMRRLDCYSHDGMHHDSWLAQCTQYLGIA